MAIEDIHEAVLAYDEDAIAGLVQAALDAGASPARILDEGLVAALDDIGERFSAGSVFVPEMLMAAETVRAGLDVLRPLLTRNDLRPAGTVVIGTVRGDLHDIGKNLVGMMLEGAGFRVVDLGTDVEPEHFVGAAQETEADIVAISALLTTSMPEMESTVAALRANGRNLSVKIMVGGPPVNAGFAERIGADAYGADAPAAVEAARGFVAGPA